MKNIFVLLFIIINILFADTRPSYMTNEEYSHYLALIVVKPNPRGYMTEEEWIFDHVGFEEEYVIVGSNLYIGAENKSNNIRFDGEFGIIAPKKKTIRNNLSEKEIIANIFKDIHSYYPNNLAEAYKELLKAVYEIKNKNRVIDDVEFYNLVNEACVYDKTVQKIDDLAYLYSKQKNVDYETLIEVYMNIIDYYPNRTVAYLNLADAYIGINDIEKAKQNYKKYTELMKQENKEDKIPKRVLKYLEN